MAAKKILMLVGDYVESPEIPQNWKMTESVDDKCLTLMKDAFKRYLLEQLGPLEDKPLFELRAWSLALLDLESLVQSHRRSFDDVTLECRAITIV